MNGEAVVNDLMISVFSEAGSCGSDLVCSVSGSANGVLTSTFTISGTESAFIAGYGDLTWSDFKSGYHGYYYQDASVIDAEKCSSITQDNMMCWAGTAANMLYYTGWGLVGTDTEDKVFSVFIDNFTLGKTYGGNAYYAIDWYFTGHYSPKNWSEWDIPLENSGGFYSEFFETGNLSSYLTSTTFTVSGLTTAKQKLEAGYGVGITFGYYDSKGTRTGGHLITLWGMTCDSSYSVTDPRYYTGIIVTDSDDNQGVSDPLSAPDTLKIISITYDSSIGSYLIDPDYAGANSRLEHLTFLAPNAYAVPDDAGPVNVYSGNILVKKGTVLTGETIVGGANNSMFVSSGGTANSTTVSSGGAVYVRGGGFANVVTVSSGGTIYIYGELLYGPAIGDWAEELPGSARGVTVSTGGSAFIHGGEVDGLMVSSGAYASAGGGDSPFNRLYYGEIKYGGTFTIGTTNEFWGSIVFGGTVTVDGYAYVYGEVVFDLSERSAADTYIVDDITGLNLSDGSCYTISVSENQANGTYKLAGNASSFSDTITIEGESLTVNGTGVTIDGKQYTLAVTDSILTLTIGAAAPPVPVGDQVKIYSSGTLVKQGTVLTGETIVGGANNSMFVYSGGSACDTIISSGGSVMVSSGGRVSNTVLRGGKLRVNSGAVAVSTFITSNGNEVNLFPGGTISGLDIQSGGRAFLRQSSVATGITASSGAILGFDVARETLFQGVYGGKAFEVKDGKLSGYEINSGCHVSVCNGGTALNIEVLSGGLYSINDNGIHRQTLYTNAGAVVSAYEGGIIDFTVSERTTADGYLINNLALIQGTPTYTITVNADQAAGTYKLAQGADILDSKSISIGTETAAFGMITVNGSISNYNDKSYALDLSNGNLTLTIGGPVLEPTDPVQVYSSGTLVKQGRILTGETIIAGTNDSMFVYDGGTASNTQVSSGAFIYVSSGGVADSTCVGSMGRIQVFSGGVANNTLLAGINTTGSYGGMDVYNGAVANNTTVSSGGYFNVSLGGMAEGVSIHTAGNASINGSASEITVHRDGILHVQRTAAASNITALESSILRLHVEADTYIQGSYAGSAFEIKNGLVSDYTVNRGYVYLYGAAANNVTVKNSSYIRLYLSGTASGTIVSSGRIEVWETGAAQDTTVIRGYMRIAEGGSARDTILSSGGSMRIEGGKHTHTLTIADGAVVSAYNGGIIDFTVSARSVSDGYLINDLSLIQGTPVYTITVSADQAQGVYKLAQGADGFKGTLTIGNGTIDYGTITVNGADLVYGNVAYSLDLYKGDLTLNIGNVAPAGDQVKVYSSGTLVKQGKVLTGETIIDGANNSMHVYSGGTASNTQVSSGANMYVSSGGTAKDTLVEGGRMTVYSGGVANGAVFNSGELIARGGKVSQATLKNAAQVSLYSSAELIDATHNGGVIKVYSGAAASNLSAELELTSRSGYALTHVSSGGVANTVDLGHRGYLFVYGGGFVSGVSIRNSGTMLVRGEEYTPEGEEMAEALHGSAKEVTVSSGGFAIVLGGEVTGLMVSSGGYASVAGVADVSAVDVYGKLYGAEIKYGGTLTIDSGGVELWEDTVLGGTVTVNSWANIYGELVFDLSERSAGDTYIVDNIANLNLTEIGCYSVTVSDNQVNGTYKLAGNAANFSDTITVEGTALSVNGAGAIVGDKQYTLAVTDSILTLTIGAAPAGDQVKVYSSGTLVKQGKVLTGETIISGANNSMFVYSGGTANSTFVNSSGLMNVSSGGLAYGTILSGANYFDIGGHAVSTSAPGEMKIHSGGIAENTRIYEGGRMYVFSGGTADETFVGSHGCLKVSSGGIANNVSMGKDWCWVGVSSGLINNVTNVGGSLGIFAGGTITNILLADNGERVYTGLCVYSGGTASNTIVNRQHVSVSSGGTVDTIEVKSGGAIYYSAGAILAGEHIYGGTVVIEGYVDAENADVTFDVSQRLTADSFIVSNLAYLNAGSFSITVAADQEKGTYMLAENADGFAGSLSVGTGTVNWGTVSVNGEQLTYNETVYKLVGESGNLHLVIEAADREAPELTITGNATEWTNKDVVLQVVCDDPEAVVSFRIDNGDWQVCTGTLTVGSNCSIEFRAVDRAGNTTTERVIVDKIDNVAPEAPKVTADITDFTNQSVTLTADYGDAVKKEFSYNNRTWYTYNGGVVLNSNSTVYFRGSDALGNVSDISSYKVANIDKAAPGVPGEVTIAINGNNAVADWNDVGDSGVSGVKGYFVRTGNSENMTGNGTFVEASRISLENLAGGTWYCQIASVDKAGNISEWSTVKSFVIGVSGPENLVSTPRGLSWDAVEGASGYVVEYSYDDFESAVAVETVTNALDSFALPGTTFKWRVRALESSVWSFGSEVTGNGSIDAEEIVSDNDGNTDLFFANANDLWGKGYAAENKFTGERIMLAGKNRLDEIFEGSSDANVLVLTDDLNGDALFVDDIYTALGDRARMEEIDEIRAGAGADVIDMTSLRYGYSGKEITIHGGDGDDVIWTGGTDSVLFGDAGDDRLAGSTCFDVFAGGSGNDTMCSGGGNDIFVFSGEFGNDTVEITDYSEVTLWFDAGSSENWDPVRRIYRSGSNSVTVTGSGAVDLKFGDEGGRYAEFAEAGLFDDVSSRKIFEEKDKGMLA